MFHREGRKLARERSEHIGAQFGRPSTKLGVFDKRPSYNSLPGFLVYMRTEIENLAELFQKNRFQQIGATRSTTSTAYGPLCSGMKSVRRRAKMPLPMPSGRPLRTFSPTSVAGR